MPFGASEERVCTLASPRPKPSPRGSAKSEERYEYEEDEIKTCTDIYTLIAITKPGRNNTFNDVFVYTKDRAADP